MYTSLFFTPHPWIPSRRQYVKSNSHSTKSKDFINFCARGGIVCVCVFRGLDLRKLTISTAWSNTDFNFSSQCLSLSRKQCVDIRIVTIERKHFISPSWIEHHLYKKKKSKEGNLHDFHQMFLTDGQNMKCILTFHALYTARKTLTNFVFYGWSEQMLTAMLCHLC